MDAYLTTLYDLNHFRLGDAATISSWFKVDSLPVDRDRWFIFESAPGFPFSVGLQAPSIDRSQTSIEFFMDTSSRRVRRHSTEIRDSETTGTWFHCAMAFDVETGLSHIFVNGEVVYEKAFPDRMAWFDRIHFGTYREADGRFFKGMIDEISLWNRALSEAEVKTLYRQIGRVIP